MFLAKNIDAELRELEEGPVYCSVLLIVYC